jgi:hypothetical protein
MTTSRNSICFSALLLLCAVLCSIPALAEDGKITISYRGAGGNYIGDTIIFDGLNTFGNTTVITITGPNLPAAGVALYDLTGTPGIGNTAKVDSRHQWSFPWDMSRIDTSLLQTARYTFTAWDSNNPSVTSSTSVLLKRPEFYMTAKPSALTPGDYVEIEGMAETGIDYVKIDVTDPAGTVMHTFMTPVSAVGFFQHGFRIDMKPGKYYITGSNPSMTKTLSLAITVSASNADVTGTPESGVTGQATTAPAATTEAAMTAETTAEATQASAAPTKSGSGVAMALLSFAGLAIAAVLLGRR